MSGPIQRRLTVAINWSVARIASLDARERYEDSYALTEEFREWILCLEDYPELLAEHVLMVPKAPIPEHNADPGHPERGSESDGLLEI